MGDSTNVIPFPTPVSVRVDRASIEAVKFLAKADLIAQGVAVRALEDFGAHADEIELLRTLYAVRRGRL